MEYNIFDKNRNINFISLARWYGDMLQIEEDGDIVTKEDAEEGVGNLLGTEELKQEFIRKVRDEGLLFEGNENEWNDDLDDDELRSCTPTLAADDNGATKYSYDADVMRYRIPYTKEEVVYLQHLLDSKFADYFFDSDDKKALQKNIELYCTENKIPKDEYKKISEFLMEPGKSKLFGTQGEHGMGQLMDVIMSMARANAKRICQGFQYVSAFSGEQVEHRAYPIEFVYSQLEERIRLLVYLEDEKRYERIYLEDIVDKRILPFKKEQDTDIPKIVEKTVLVAVKDENNAYEKFVGGFQEYKRREFTRNYEKNGLKFILFEYPSIDTARVRIRLLRLGRYVRVIDEKDIIKKITGVKKAEVTEILQNGEELKGWLLDQLQHLNY